MQQTMVDQAVQHFRDGHLDQAEPMFRRMLADEPDNPQVLLMLALIAQQRGHNEQGVELVQQALATSPENPSLHHALGNLRLRLGDVKAARGSFRKAVELNPNHAEAITSLGYCLLMERRFEDAEAQLRVALRADPDHVPALVSLGTALLEQQKYEDAIRYLKHAVEQAPDNARAQAQLGRAFLGNGQAAFADQCFSNARPELDGMPDLHEWQGQARFKLGDAEAAARSWQRVLKLGAERPDSLYGLARIATARGQFRQAGQWLQRAVQLAPNRSDMRLALVGLMVQTRRWEEAGQAMAPLLEQPALAKPARRLAVQVALGQGDLKAAREQLNSLLGQEPEAIENLMLAVEVARAEGDQQAQAQSLDRLLALPEPPLAAQLLRARLHRRQGQLADAEQLLQKAQQREGLAAADAREVAAMLADVQFEQKQPEAAVNTLASLPRRIAGPMLLQQESSQRQAAGADASTAMTAEAGAWLSGLAGSGEKAPVFMLSWPGSGADALLAALAAHDGIHVLADSLASQAARRTQLGWPRGIEALRALGNADCDLQRRRYRRALRSVDPEGHQVAESKGGLLVDALQLDTGALPSLARLYPGATVLLPARDARDLAVTWLFEGCDELEAMASHWRDEQDQLALCREHLPLQFIELDHDRLAEDPEAGLRSLVEKLGLDWQPAVLAQWQSRPAHGVKKAGSWRALEPWLGATLKQLG